MRTDDRGFTTLEAIIALVLLAIVLILGIRVVGAWANASQQQLARVDLSRDRQLALATMHDDFATLRTCEDDRLGAHLRSFRPDRIVFYADPDADGTVDLVTYTAAGGQLERTVQVRTGPDCTAGSFTEPASAVLLGRTAPAIDVDTDGDSDATFRGYRDGQPATTTEDLDCAGQTTASADCLFDLIEVHLTTGAAASTSLDVHRTYPIDAGWSRVRRRG